jgi:type VI secretion system protein ImpJ
MQHLPVHWTEGLFLTAQHFQASERHWHELLFHSERFQQAYYYGLRNVRYSPDAIANLSFQIDACQARSRRGTLLSFGEGEEPDRINFQDKLGTNASPTSGPERLDLEPLLADRQAVRIFLATPKLRLGAANVGLRGEIGMFRFNEVPPLALQDENSGGNDQEVGFRSINVRLIAKLPRGTTPGLPGEPPRWQFDDDDPDFELLPLAQVRRGGEAGPELDTSYIPPVLACDAWPPLQRGILQAIYDRIGREVERQSTHVIARQVTLASPEPGDLERLLFLNRINEAYATLGVLSFASGIHPLVAYTTLAQIVGQLSIFDKETRRVPAIPKYDHDDLGYIFHWMMRQIQIYLDLFGTGPEAQYRPFVGRSNGMQVGLEPSWLGPGYKWYVGVKYESLTADECRGLLAPNFLFWKLASLSKVDEVFRKGLPGMVLVPQNSPPKELPSKDWIYFEVSRSGDAWQNVVAEQTLAMRYKDALVDNRNSLEGQRTMVINVPPPKNIKVPLQFGLWAVPMRQ